MVETHWDGLRGERLRYVDHAWELTGDVDVLENGDVLAVAATQVDDVRRAAGRLYFGLVSPPHSLNPGNLGDHFDDVVRTNDDQFLVVRRAGRTYRYELQRLEYR